MNKHKKIYLDINSEIQYLKINKKLNIINEQNFVNFLSFYGYQVIINGYKKPFTRKKHGNKYFTESCTELDLINLFNFDLKIHEMLTIELFNIEKYLNNWILKNWLLLCDTKVHLSKNENYNLINFLQHFDNTRKPNRDLFLIHDIYRQLNEYIKNTYSSEPKSILFKNLNEEFNNKKNNDQTYLSTTLTKQNVNLKQYSLIKNNLLKNKYQVIPFSIAFLKLSFGNLNYLLNDLYSLNKKIKYLFLNQVNGCDEEIFLFLMYIFQLLRNSMAHNNALYRYKVSIHYLLTSYNQKIAKVLILNNKNASNSNQNKPKIKINKKELGRKKIINFLQSILNKQLKQKSYLHIYDIVKLLNYVSIKLSPNILNNLSKDNILNKFHKAYLNFLRTYVKDEMSLSNIQGLKKEDLKTSRNVSINNLKEILTNSD